MALFIDQEPPTLTLHTLEMILSTNKGSSAIETARSFLPQNGRK